MTKAYNFREIEGKWQKRWLDEKLFEPRFGGGKKMYVLDMFPYPSGDGLHVGHVKIYTASDVISRYLRMRGYAVLHPTGWDAFGLPTENSAIKKGVHPRDLTVKNVGRFREQMQMMGFSYDWSREINTTDPEYYRWTQWIFLRLFQMGLAYQDTMPINWCPSCKTGLANEEVEEGKCERCGTLVEEKPIRQWMLRITKYADRLLAGLNGLSWPESIVQLQKNWIGRSEGTEIDFKITGEEKPLRVFTTRTDTIFGASYVALSYDHPLVLGVLSGQRKAVNAEEIKRYVDKTKQEEAVNDREEKKKTGLKVEGLVVINPVNGEELSVWVVNYVTMTYGTGAVMGVPAHDERDYAFAREYGLPVKQVIKPKLSEGKAKLPYMEEGVLVNSADYSGKSSLEGRKIITKVLQQKGVARRKIHYKLRDWVFSRQRYWGEPIPIIHCDNCGQVPVPEDQLPVTLPEVERYEPTGTGESPLAAVEDWVKVKCPTCSREGRRETNTMPQWAGSSWYWLRYLDPNNGQVLASEEEMNKWLPVDIYVGGAEHAVLHLLYARFWNYVLFDDGVVAREEPFSLFRSVGLVLGEDGQKMSKSKGNVINPDEVVNRIGVDALRVYVMFMGPFDNAMSWSETSLHGAVRFLSKVWTETSRLAKTINQVPEEDEKLKLLVQQTIKRVTESTEQFKFNTAIASLMEFLNSIEKKSHIDRYSLESFVLLLSPYAPHLAEELWQVLGHTESLMYYQWPWYDETILKRASVTVPVQVNGKVRGEVVLESVATEQTEVENIARELPNVRRYLEDADIKKVIYVPGKTINFVIRSRGIS